MVKKKKTETTLDVIKVNKSALLSFLEMMILKGKLENKEALVTVSPKGIETLILCSNKTVALRGLLKGNFKDWGSIGINDLVLLKNIISPFNADEINMDKLENKLILTSADKQLEIKIVLRKIDYIINKMDTSKFESFLNQAKGNEFTLPIEKLKEISNHFSTLNPTEFSLELKNKKLTIELGSEQNELKNEIDLKESVEPATVKLSELFVSIISVLNDDVKISFKENSPVSIVIDNKNYKFEFVLAPVEQ